MVVSAKSLTLKLDGLVMFLYKHYVSTNDIALSENGVPQENPWILMCIAFLQKAQFFSAHPNESNSILFPLISSNLSC
jgi:hypothetical protein